MNRCCRIGIMLSVSLFIASTSHAAGAGQDLSADYDQVLPMSLFKYGDADDPIKQQPIFRTSGEYDWKWIDKTYGFNGFAKSENGLFHYYDNHNMIHVITSDGEKVWTTEPLQYKIESVRRVNNGNLVVVSESTGSTVSVIGSSAQPANTKRLYIFNQEGKLILDELIISPYQPFGGISFFTDERLLFLSGEGLVCTDLNGKKLWVMGEPILITQDKLKQWFSNVQQISPDNNGTFKIYMTDGTAQTFDKDQKLLSSEKITKVKLQIDSNSSLTIHKREDGLYLWKNEWLTEEETRSAYLDSLSRSRWTYYNVPWNGGSYETTEQDNNLVAKDKEGHVLWTYFTPESQFGHPSNVIANQDGDVFFKDNGGNVYGLDSEGNEIFRLIRNSKSAILTTLSLTPDGGIIGVTGDIGLFRIAKSGIDVTIEGLPVAFDQKPLLVEGSLLVPFRPVFEKLGLTVQWDDSSATVSGTKPGTQIKLKIGSQEALVNGQPVPLAAPPQMIGGSTYVPLRFIGEATGLQVEWDGVDREVRVGSPEQLAKQAVNRFMKHISQGDDAKATNDLTDSSRSIMERAPTLAPFFVRKQWESDMERITASPTGTDSFLVKTVQRNRSFDSKEARSSVREYTYTIKRTADGQWKIEDTDLFRIEPFDS